MDGLRTSEPFIYPATPHVRKHGPSGYVDYGAYKDWLRDDFDFRCVYCLTREVWGLRQGVWAVEHLVPRKERPDLTTCYANLVLSCGRCNSVKGTKGAPDPCGIAYGTLVTVSEKGIITAQEKEGDRLIKTIRLDDPESTEWRRKHIAMIKNLRQHDPGEYESWMGFPEDLPNLQNRRVEKNTKPGGVANCRHSQQKSGTLPSIYEIF